MRTSLAAALCMTSLAASAEPILAARVNGAGIALDLVDRQFEELLRERNLNIARMNNPVKAKGMKREALNNLIRVELLWQEAKATGLVVSDAEVARAVAEVRGRFRNEETFLRRLEAIGFDEKSFREHSRKTLSSERLAQRVVERDVKVTDKDVEEFYAENPRSFKRPEQLKVRQILVALPVDPSPAKKEQARRKIDDLAARVRAGESFEALARQHSDDATRQWGGELDPFARGEKHPAFEAAAFALQPGGVAPVVETPAGLHLLKLEERTPAVTMSLADAKERIREHLKRLRGKEAIDNEVERLRAKAKVEMLTPL
jgi:parvulin-like peptidyl-prolyl isomerase